MIKINISYPCGYEVKYHLSFFSGWFGDSDFKHDDSKGCPIHGKDCAPIIEVKTK